MKPPHAYGICTRPGICTCPSICIRSDPYDICTRSDQIPGPPREWLRRRRRPVQVRSSRYSYSPKTARRCRSPTRRRWPAGAASEGQAVSRRSEEA